MDYPKIIAILVVLAVLAGMIFFPNYSSVNTYNTYNIPTPYKMPNETTPESISPSPVFCEYASSTTCKYCPKIGDILYDIYKEGKYPVCIVSLVYDKNSVAEERLKEDYNIKGFPTVFFNGGERVIYGADFNKNEIEQIIKSLAEKKKPDIAVNLSASLDENTSRIYTMVRITNNESKSFSGMLKVYLAEINSRWYDYDGKPYHFAFLDYLLEKSIFLNPDETKNYTSEWDYSKYKPIDRNNLIVTAVIFSNKTETRFSDPPDNSNSFTAHPVDALAVKQVSKGNLPPKVGISLPKKGKIHFRSKPLLWAIFGKTWIIGKINVKTKVSDDGNYIKLEFYVDEELKQTITDTGDINNKEYTFQLNGPLFGKHTLSIKAYDREGKQSETSLGVRTIIFFP